MADNRLELEITATDTTGPAAAKARANFNSIEKDAAKAAANMSKGFDASAVEMSQKITAATEQGMRSLDALARRAELAGKSALEKLYFQRNNIPTNLGDDRNIVAQYQAHYDKLIAARKKYEDDRKKQDSESEHGVGSMALRRGFLAAKDFGEGRVQGTFAEIADILFGQGGSGGVVQKFIPQIAEITGLSNGAVIAIGSLAGAFAGLGFAGIESMKSLAETGEEIRKFSANTGIAPTRVQAFQFAAKAEGADPSIFGRLSSEISRAGDDFSEEGTKKREQLGRLGVNLYDRFGDLKPTEQVLLDIADGLDKLSPGLERNAAAARLFGESSKEVLPVLENLRRNLATSDEIGNTFSEHDIAMMERWHESLTRISEEWHRFKLSVEVPLAILGEVTLKGIRFLGIPSGGIGVGGSYAAQLGEKINSMLFQQGEITPPAADPNALKKSADKDLADQARERYLALRRQDPNYRLAEERNKLNQLDASARHGTAEENEAALDQYKLVQRLEASKKDKSGGQDLIAAAKERQQLLAQSAEIAESSQQSDLAASLDSKRELTTPQDIERLLDLAKRRAVADENRFINDHRNEKGQVSAQFLDAANENLSQRIENEQDKVLAKISEKDIQYFRARTDADGKAWDEAGQRRLQREAQLQQDEINLRQQIQTKAFDINGSSIDRQRDIALQSLDGVNAQTIQEKTALEDRKLAIEQAYSEKSLENQIAKLENERAIKIGRIQGTDASQEIKDSGIAGVRDEYEQQIDAARAATTDREILDAQKAQAAKEKLQLESNRRVYDSLKSDAAGLFDQLVSHTKSWGDFAKDLFKSAILTPVKDIFSSQVAALFTKGLTGQDVSFGEVGNGQGAFGKLGSIFGRAGLGQPKFGSNQPISKLDQPGHLGDVNLVQGGAVPVVLMNAGGGTAPASSGGGFSLGSLTAGLGLGGLFSGGAAAAATAPISSGTSYSLGGIIDGTASPGSFESLARTVGGPGGTSGFAGPVAGYGGGLGGILRNLGGSFGLGSSGTDLGNGVGIANTGILGRLAAFGKSGGAALLGGTVALDGIRRGGIGGTLEAAGGGALVGFKYGGPIGALVGAAIGGGIAGFKSIFGTTDRQHAKDLVKQVYGMDVNNATADQIVAIAKQAYGGQIDVAVRSPQVRDMLKLYAQTVGNKSAQDQFVQSQVHSASFVESGGKLQQQAIYDNGNAYSYSSPLSVYGGVQTSPLSTYAPNQGVFNGNLQINLNGQSASDVLAGQVVRVATPSFVQGQALAASGSSVGRTAQQNMVLSPSALSR